MAAGAEISGFMATMPVATPATRSMVDNAPPVADQESPRVRAQSATRIDAIDAARFVAILGIVFIHSVETPQLVRLGYIGTFGVPFYLFASLFFQARAFRRNPHRPLDQYIAA